MRMLESDPEIMKFTPAKIPQTPEQTKTKLEALVAKEKSYGDFGVWAAETSDTKDFIGWFMLIKTDLEFHELGFMLVQKHWGMKYATEVSKALIDYGIQKLGLPGIAARTNTQNLASIRVLEKLGFIYQSTKNNAEGIPLKIFHLNLKKESSVNP